MLSRVFGTPEANVPVASAGISGKSVAEGAGELVGCPVEHMVTAARDAFARGLTIFPAVLSVVGVGLEQTARPLGLVAREVEHALGRRSFWMTTHRIGLAAPASENSVLRGW